MNTTSHKFSTLWVEDDHNQKNFWETELAKYFDIRLWTDNYVEALEFVDRSKSSLQVIITDLRIKSGPDYPDYPPIHTNYVYGIALLSAIQKKTQIIPALAYSRFLAPTDPTRVAVDHELPNLAILLNVYGTPIAAGPVVRQMYEDVCFYYEQRGLAKKHRKYSVAAFTKKFPPQVTP